MELYTAGIWTVRPGREDDFVGLWSELADWTLTRFPDARGTLLRSREPANRFLSFGTWESTEQIEEWRSAPEWQDVVGRIQELLEAFEPGVYDVAAKAGG